MDVVQIFNGLGNQMSQYAFFLAKKEQTPHVLCLYYPAYGINQHNGFELQSIFGIDTVKDCNGFLGHIYGLKLYSKSRKGKKRQLLDIIYKLLDIVIITEHPCYDYDSEMLKQSKHCLSYFYGGWHSEKYFHKYREQLVKVYHFDEKKLNDQSKNLLDRLRDEPSVSIHIRRGDYVEDGLFSGISTIEYYRKAIDYIDNRIPKAQYYVFSDDPQWAKDNLNVSNLNVVDWNKGADSWQDMCLISHCKHNINANSTFSWWGAWLNQNPNKIVIVPSKFFNYGNTKDFYPDDWIKING